MPRHLDEVDPKRRREQRAKHKKTDLGPGNLQPIIHPFFLQIHFPHNKKKALMALMRSGTHFINTVQKKLEMDANGPFPSLRNARTA